MGRLITSENVGRSLSVYIIEGSERWRKTTRLNIRWFPSYYIFTFPRQYFFDVCLSILNYVLYAWMKSGQTIFCELVIVIIPLSFFDPLMNNVGNSTDFVSKSQWQWILSVSVVLLTPIDGNEDEHIDINIDIWSTKLLIALNLPS
jgi:hypothetical protein